MSLIWFLEGISFVLGLFVFKLEVINLKCRNFVPSMFILLYFPLFCITPLLYHLLIGGAMTIDRKVDGLIYTDTEIYVVYHFYNISMLICFLLVSSFMNKFQYLPKNINYRGTFKQNLFLFAFLFLGVYLYVYSTGLSVFELLVADRFTWFENSNYSSFFSVVSSFFISLTPLLIYIYLKNKKYFFLTLTIILMIIYGILSKDRKWIIFMISGALGARYILSSYKIVFKPKIIIWSVVLGLVLMFWQIFRDVLVTELVTGRGDFLSHALEMGEQLALKGDFPYYYFSSITAIKMNLIDEFSIPLGIIRRQLFFIIPVDYSFGLKLKDISAIFSDALDAGDQIRGGNMPPGLIGLFVLSFNWWAGLIFFSMIPFLLFYINKIVRQNTSILQPVIYSNCFSFMILLLRGDDSSAFYFFIFNLIIFVTIKFLFVTKEVRPEISDKSNN